MGCLSPLNSPLWELGFHRLSYLCLRLRKLKQFILKIAGKMRLMKAMLIPFLPHQREVYQNEHKEKKMLSTMQLGNC